MLVTESAGGTIATVAELSTDDLQGTARQTDAQGYTGALHTQFMLAGRSMQGGKHGGHSPLPRPPDQSACGGSKGEEASRCWAHAHHGAPGCRHAAVSDREPQLPPASQPPEPHARCLAGTLFSLVAMCHGKANSDSSAET